jgi:hypothetical protein
MNPPSQNSKTCLSHGRRPYKKARKRTPLSRPLRGCPPSGSVRRGLRKLALRAQTCAALFPPAEPSSRRARGDRKCRCSAASARLKFRRGSVHPKSPFRPAEQRTSGRGSPARLSEPEGRVPRRPPAGSSAGESAAGRPGKAGSPSLPSFLAKQERRSPAGAKSRPTPRQATERPQVRAQALPVGAKTLSTLNPNIANLFDHGLWSAPCRSSAREGRMNRPHGHALFSVLAPVRARKTPCGSRR